MQGGAKPHRDVHWILERVLSGIRPWCRVTFQGVTCRGQPPDLDQILCPVRPGLHRCAPVPTPTTTRRHRSLVGALPTCLRRSTQRLAENYWKRSNNRDFWTSPPRERGQKRRMRGRSKKSFQARTWPMVSLVSIALSASVSAIRIVERYLPWSNLRGREGEDGGGVFITQARVANSSSKLTKSNDANASRTTF